jgi:hypothetical protein
MICLLSFLLPSFCLVPFWLYGNAGESPLQRSGPPFWEDALALLGLHVVAIASTCLCPFPVSDALSLFLFFCLLPVLLPTLPLLFYCHALLKSPHMLRYAAGVSTCDPHCVHLNNPRPAIIIPAIKHALWFVYGSDLPPTVFP